MLPIIVSGAKGRVGKLLLQAIEAEAGFSLQYPVFRETDFEALEISENTVWIDFSTPLAALNYLQTCVEKKCPMVIGTTGFSAAEKEKILEAAQLIPIVMAPNMSLGVNISYQLLSLATRLLKAQLGEDALNVGIVDIHHQHKKDAPSGTALKMAEKIKETAPKTTLNISSVRLGDTIGEHTALFGLPSERITITHQAQDRLLYAKGALVAAKWVAQQKPGLYDMQDVLNG